MKDKRPGARIYQCLAECCVTKTHVAVDISQNRTTKHLPIVCDKTNNGELCQMLRPFPDASGKQLEVTKYRISVTH